MRTFKGFIALIAAVLMIACFVPRAAMAEEERPTDVKGHNLVRITTAADFAGGKLSDLVPVSSGDGALALAEGKSSGTFVSTPYEVDDFLKMNATWNVSVPGDSSVQIEARALSDGEWSDWFSWGRFGIGIRRGSDEDDIDEFSPGGTITQVQLKATLNAASDGGSPVLRQIAFTLKGGDVTPHYEGSRIAERDLPMEIMNKAPGYAQGQRDPAYGGSICSPTTISVLLNGRDPALDLLPEETALSFYDFDYGFGNWSFCVSGAALFGYESCGQYADQDILIQELANGRTAGISVQYSTDPADDDYLENAYGSTGGHLISIIGYRYDGGIRDDAHLVFYSSDSYSPADPDCFREYRWSDLDACWASRYMYHVSEKPEEGAAYSGVVRHAAELRPVEGQDGLYDLRENGETVDLTDFTAGKQSIAGRGSLFYTIEGIGYDELEATAYSIVYPERIRVSANDKPFYSGIGIDDDGNIAFDAPDALFTAGVPEGESRGLTVYAVSNTGHTYRAALTATSRDTPAVEEEIREVPVTGNLVKCDLGEGTVTGGAVIKEDGTVAITDGATSGRFISPAYVTEWQFEYLLPTLLAETPGASTVELEVRAATERGEGKWEDYLTYGRYGSGIMSVTQSAETANTNLDGEIFCISGSSSVANGSKVQFRIRLKADADGNRPVIHGLYFTYKKPAYSDTEAVYTGGNAAEELPASAEVPMTATSAYDYAGGLEGFRYGNSMLMMLNAEGEDLLFEEAALTGYDFEVGDSCWSYFGFRPGLFGHEAYAQFGATPELVQHYLADGNSVTLIVNGGELKHDGVRQTTNSGKSRPVVFYKYETQEDGTVLFYSICPSGDSDELAGGDVYGVTTAEELKHAIEAAGSSSARGLAYVVGPRRYDSSRVRRLAASTTEDGATYRLSLYGDKIEVPQDFAEYKDSASGYGVVSYIMSSEKKEGRLAGNAFRYDIAINRDGTLTVPSGVEAAIAGGDKAEVYIVYNNGLTYFTSFEPLEKEQEREQAAGAVEAQIDALPDAGELGPDDAAAVRAAREAYEGLDDEGQALIGNLQKLEAAEERIASLETHREYVILESGNGVDPAGSFEQGVERDYRLVCDGGYETFLSVDLDGEEVAAGDYTVSSGSTILVFKGAYVKTLAPGAHEVVMNYADGRAVATITAFVKESPGVTGTGGHEKPVSGEKSPATGESGGLAYVLVLSMAIMGLIVAAFLRRFPALGRRLQCPRTRR